MNGSSLVAMPKKGSKRASDPSSEYDSWNTETATARALEHASRSQAVDRATGGIWNFAFGSNLNPAIVADRGMAPLHAVRGRLPGWSLLFSHRGGYGNIESTAAIAERGLDVTRLSPQVPEPEPEPGPGPEPGIEARPQCARDGCTFLRHTTQAHAYCCIACKMRGGAHGGACERDELEAGPDVAAQRPQDEVHGALLLLSKEDFGRLASEEYGYDTVEVAVHVYDEDLAASYRQEGKKQKGRAATPKIGALVHALAFKSSACAEVEASALPSTRYVRLLREGAAMVEIAKGYREWLEAIPSLSVVH